MKKIYTLFSVLVLTFLFISAGYAQTGGFLLTEDFNPVSTPQALVGWNGWVIVGTSTVAPLTVTAGSGLSYTNVLPYDGSGVGAAVVLTTNGQDCMKPLSTPATTGSVYAAAMVNVTATGTTGDYFFHFGDGGTSNFYGKVMVRTHTGGGAIDFGVAKRSNASTVAPGNPLWTGGSGYGSGTHLLVVKYTFIGTVASDDMVSLFVDPVIGGGEPGTPTLGPTNDGGTGADVAVTGLTNIYIRQGNASAVYAPQLTIDGIRVGTTWENTPLPVELSSFTSNVNGRNVTLNWSTKTEKNSDRFSIERISNGAWESIGSVKAAVLSNSPKQYSFSDKNLNTGNYQYRLKMIDNDGSFNYSSVTEAAVTQPMNFELSQNYPNPFNPSTKINYSLPSDSRVTLEVYNVLGVKVGQLVNQDQSAGYYSVDFSSSSLSKSITSGVYLYKISTVDKVTGNNFSAIKKMMLLK